MSTIGVTGSENLQVLKVIKVKPAEFVDLDTMIPDLVMDVRYAGSENFVGEPINGYLAPEIILTRPAAVALQAVQSELREFGLGLKVFDGYRPQRAVDHFVAWAQDLEDNKMKSRYYPNVAKENLFAEGYIAERSGHSRGSTVDLTIVAAQDEGYIELNMGTAWDFFDPASWAMANLLAADQRANRLLLRNLMTKYGFVPLAEEWWHFTYIDEPFPDSYFDFPVE